MATSLTSDPFEHFSFDGVVGLGLGSLALHEKFSFFGRMVEAGRLNQPCFSVFLSKGDEPGRSEVTFGGHREERAMSDFQWAPVVVPEQGFWQVSLRGVRVGDEKLDICSAGGCRAVLDTGTSMLGVPQQALSRMHRLLLRVASPDTDCRQLEGPSIFFDLGDFELRLNAEEYSRPTPMKVKTKSGNMSYVCRSSLLPMPAEESVTGSGDKAEIFVFGEPILQGYYTKYNWREKSVGFAVARQDQVALKVQV